MRETEWCVRVQAFRGGHLLRQTDLPLAGNETFVRSFDDVWGLPTGPDDAEDLYVVRYISVQQSDLSRKFLGAELEGQIFFSMPGHHWYASVINGFVPERAESYKFSPIFHAGHYFLADARFMTYLCLVNYNGHKRGAPLQPGENSMEFRLISDSGKRLGAITKSVTYNSTFLISVSELLREAGGEEVSERHVNVHVRGGSSQYAIYTVFRNTREGTIGVEHSLAPHYYTEAVKKPVMRAILQRNIFGVS
jgi:hypothetical protein